MVRSQTGLSLDTLRYVALRLSALFRVERRVESIESSPVPTASAVLPYLASYIVGT